MKEDLLSVVVVQKGELVHNFWLLPCIKVSNNLSCLYLTCCMDYRLKNLDHCRRNLYMLKN